jgi:hypothetical protein
MDALLSPCVPVCRAGSAGRGTPVARATERFNLAPDPKCISGRFYFAGGRAGFPAIGPCMMAYIES